MLSPHVSAPSAVAALCCAVVAGATTTVAAPAEKRTFHLPRGDAAVTLKQFAAAAGTPIVYLVDRVRGATTNAVNGEFVPREALDRMLAGSGLEAAQDAATGAFVVSRQRSAETVPQTGEVGPASDPQPKPKTLPMKSPRTLLAAVVGWLTTAVAPLPFAQTTVPAPADDLVQLTPFEVRIDKDSGFVASSSLAGGRLAGQLVETPVAYSVQTREFLDALNISDLNEALDWTVNATTTPDDGGGQLFGGTGGGTIRGVRANQTNRNFFTGGSNPSTYNLERMDYGRGPNSVLFGTGTISGTANAVLKSARFGRNATEVRAEYGSWDSYRGTVDANYSTKWFERNVAVRTVATLQNTQTWRDWERTERNGFSPSLTAELTRTTKLSVIGDYYEQKATAGMNSLNDSFSGWDGRTVYSGLQPTNLPSQSAFGASRMGNNIWVVSPASGRGYDTALSYTGMMQTTFYAGQRAIDGVTPPAGAASLSYNAIPILDQMGFTPGVYDAAEQGSAFRVPKRSFTNLGPNPTSINRFRGATAFLDQRVGEALSLQLSGDVNRTYNYGLIDYYTNQQFPLTYIDVNRLLPDGTTNPNFLKPYNEFIRPERQRREFTNKAVRFAAAYLKDTRWFDLKANLIGAIEKQDIFAAREYYMIPFDPDPRAWGLITSARTRTLRYRTYWDQPQREIVEMKQIALVDPVAGTSATYSPLWVLASDRNDATSDSSATTKYYQASANLSFWKKRFILLGAFRADQVDRKLRYFLRPMDHPADFGVLTRDHFIYRPDAPPDYFTLTYVPKNAAGVPTGPLQSAPVTRPRDTTTGLAQPQYANDRFQDDFNPPATSTRKPTTAFGGIWNVGRGISLWANFAETFNPTDFTRTTIDYETPPPSVSEGRDYGIRFSLGQRLYATFSRYESQEIDAPSSSPSGASNLQTIINANVLGDTSAEGRNRRGVGDLPISWNDMLDRRSEGYELEVVGNPTPGWRLTLNVGLADATQTNAFRQTRAWVDRHTEVLKQILDDAGVLVGADNIARADPARPSSFVDTTNALNAWNSLQSARANWVSGTQKLTRLTRYTANIYSDYRFSDGRWRGLRLGYGMQFRGPQVIGYRGADTVVDPSNPTRAIDDPAVDAYTVVNAKRYFLATLTLGYPLKLGRQKVDLNLSITNLFNYDEPQYNTVGIRAANGDLSTPARTTYPRAYSYTTPRSFRLSTVYQF